MTVCRIASNKHLSSSVAPGQPFVTQHLSRLVNGRWRRVRVNVGIHSEGSDNGRIIHIANHDRHARAV